MAQTIEDGAKGCIFGGAVGDSIGGSTEGRTPEVIRERYGGWVTDFVGPFQADWQTARPISPLHKGDGHVTDDTLMVLALSSVYQTVRDHLTAFDMADQLIPEIADKVIYVPEFERETVLVNRLFYAEKYLLLRLRYAHVDPREAGVGNVVNCGAAMYMAPVGIVNAGDPESAYREAIEIAGAHQSSYGREAAGVMAAAVAEAMRPGAGVDSIIEVCLGLARDGTRDAIQAVTAAARTIDNWEAAIPVLRDAVRPFDSVGEDYRAPHIDARKPSRTKAIEELPVALGMLVACGGAYLETVFGGINYGRDADSIAGMGGAIAGALHGAKPCLPSGWRTSRAPAARISRRSHLTWRRWLRKCSSWTGCVGIGVKRVFLVYSSGRCDVRITWLKPEERLEHEFRQLAEEGVDATDLAQTWRASEGFSPPERRALAERLLDACRGYSDGSGSGSEAETSTWLEGQTTETRTFAAAELEQRILAGWTGRMAGCLLGKPVEKVPRKGIRAILESSNRSAFE